MPIEIFFSYAHADEQLMDEVRRQLIVHERNGKILKWHDRMIRPGSEWVGEIDHRLRQARIILLFMSPHFIESRYCYEIEGQFALKQHEAGVAQVIPIVLRPCEWGAAPFGRVQALPKDAKPISTWSNVDEASLDAARGVMKVVDSISSLDSPPNGLDTLVSTDAPQKPEQSLIYCSRCGVSPASRSICTGAYSEHAFRKSSRSDYCERCGAPVGERSICVGAYSNHSFVPRSGSQLHCARCGVSPGERTICTGAYSSHAFEEF